jgi:Zn-dependent peptidase ImmA (M78 family)
MNRLRAYRELEGMTQAELGVLLRLSPAMVSGIESGSKPFTGDLAAIGYRSDRFNLPSMSEPLHRLRSSTAVASRNRAKELLRLAGEVFAELAGATKRSPRLRLARYASPQSLDDLDEIASDVRAVLEHEQIGPIRNLTAAVERAGVCLVPIVGLEGIDGLSSWVNGYAVIGLSTTAPGDRFRMTLAHELGHLLFHIRSGDGTETEANQFASALLFPRDDFDIALPERPHLRDFIALKAAWGVSVAALVYRAHELGYIDDSRYRALQIQLAKWRRHEPGSFEPAYGELFPRLVEVNGGVDTVAQKLGVPKSHLADTINWRRLRVA